MAGVQVNTDFKYDWRVLCFCIQIELRHSYVAIASVILFVSVMNAPNFLTYKIMELGLNETCVITDESVRYESAYVPGVSDMAVERGCLVRFIKWFLIVTQQLFRYSVWPFGFRVVLSRCCLASC